MSANDWREDWLAEELAAEAALSDPPNGASDRVLAGVLAATAATATVTAATSATAATTSGAATTGGAASALWLKGVVLTGLVAGGVGLSQIESAPPAPIAPVSTQAEPTHAARGPAERPRAPASTAPTSALVVSLATNTPVAPPTAPTSALVVSLATNTPVAPPSAARRPTPIVIARPAPKRPAPSAGGRREPTRSRPATRTRAQRTVAPSTPARRAVTLARPSAPTTVARAAPRSELRLPVSTPKPTGDTGPAPSIRPGLAGAAPDAELRAQRHLLTRALAALRAKDPAGARQHLRAYRRRFGQGRLTEEYRYIDIRTRVAAGQTTEARAAARRFLADHAESPFRPFMERLLR